jgi:hypothetical protein
MLQKKQHLTTPSCWPTFTTIAEMANITAVNDDG